MNSFDAKLDNFDAKKDYPSTQLKRFVKPPITKAEISALLNDLSKKPLFQGAWTLTEGGLPVVILHAIDKKNFSCSLSGMTGVLAWNWNHHFGRLMSFSIVAPKDKRMPRIFLPDDSIVVRSVAEHGKISFAVCHKKRITSFYEADFANNPKNPNMLLTFRSNLEVEDNERFIFRDDDLAYWLIMADSDTHWYKDLTIKDGVRAVWAQSYEAALLTFLDGLTLIRSHDYLDPYITEDGRTNVPIVMPFLDEVLRLFINPTVSSQQIVSLVASALPDQGKIGDLINGSRATLERDSLQKDLHGRIWESLHVALLSPESTNCGLRRPWLDGRLDVGDVKVKYININFGNIGELNRGYWFDYGDKSWFDLGYVLTDSDIPIPQRELYKEAKGIKLDCTESEADEAIRALLFEAKEGRQWSVPWGARVQVDVGFLKYLDVFELEGEFIGVFRDQEMRFLTFSVNIMTGDYSLPMIFAADESSGQMNDNADAQFSLVLVLASVVRDFVVIEDREALFSARLSKGPQCKTNKDLSVIYIPRVRYLKADYGEFEEYFQSEAIRAAHKVSGHLRKAEKPSGVQLLLAKRYGLHVPKGYTFVRPHCRGGKANIKTQRIYRSRSASSILYKTLSKAPKGNRPKWFDFEKDVAAFMASKGFEVIHQAASRNGDGGVDVYAHDSSNDTIWAIQCKCYSPNRKVGPGIVRELAGSLHRYPDGTRGMIVTTSSLTPAALKEASVLNIEAIDGKKFSGCIKQESISI